eukprot:1159813-Pelagomonas_calceolata.AAC.19
MRGAELACPDSSVMLHSSDAKLGTPCALRAHNMPSISAVQKPQGSTAVRAASAPYAAAAAVAAVLAACLAACAAAAVAAASGPPTLATAAAPAAVACAALAASWAPDAACSSPGDLATMCWLKSWQDMTSWTRCATVHV